MYSPPVETFKLYYFIFYVHAVVESCDMKFKIFLYVQNVIKSKYFILVFRL